jgi:hypothetical protein
MIAPLFRAWIAAILTVLLAGQQLACACASHDTIRQAVSTAQDHHHGHQDVHSGHAANPKPSDIPVPDCGHCGHTGLMAAPAIDFDVSLVSQPVTALTPLAQALEFAWRLPIRTRERPPPIAGPPILSPSFQKTRLLI